MVSHALVFVCCVFAGQTWPRNKADLKPRARRILWIVSLACAIRSFAAFSVRACELCRMHHSQPTSVKWEAFKAVSDQLVNAQLGNSIQLADVRHSPVLQMKRQWKKDRYTV